MTFANTEKMVDQLITGLGKEVPMFEPFSRSVRLHLEGVSSVASLAIQRRLEDQGIEARVVISEPHIDVDPDWRHAFVVASVVHG